MAMTKAATLALSFLLIGVAACSGNDANSPEEGGQPDHCPDRDMACCIAYVNAHPLEGNTWRGDVLNQPLELFKGEVPDPCDKTTTLGINAQFSFIPYPINKDDNLNVQYTSYTHFICQTTYGSREVYDLPRIQGTYMIEENNRSLTIHGLDFFPFLDDEEYRVNLTSSLCTQTGGDYLKLELTRADYPVSLIFSHY